MIGGGEKGDVFLGENGLSGGVRQGIGGKKRYPEAKRAGSFFRFSKFCRKLRDKIYKMMYTTRGDKMDKPALIIIAGRPGSGKSTLAHIIAKEIRCPLISRDEIKEGYINTIETEHNKIPKEENIKIYDTFFNVIELLLNNRITIVAEAAFQHKLWFPKYEMLKQKSEIKMIICKAEENVAYRRYLERKNKDPLREYFHGDAAILADGNIYEPPRFPEPVLEVDTTNEYKPNLSEIKAFITNKKSKQYQ
jgi:predicted kinase